jgi:hypothetical protein
MRRNALEVELFHYQVCTINTQIVLMSPEVLEHAIPLCGRSETINDCSIPLP